MSNKIRALKEAARIAGSLRPAISTQPMRKRWTRMACYASCFLLSLEWLTLGRRLPSNTRDSIFYLVSTRPGVWDLSLKSRLNMPKVSRLDFLYMKYTVSKSPCWNMMNVFDMDFTWSASTWIRQLFLSNKLIYSVNNYLSAEETNPD